MEASGFINNHQFINDPFDSCIFLFFMTDTHHIIQMSLQSLTYPHVEVGSQLATVLQHQIGVPVIKGSHLGGVQEHCLHLLHPPHSEARLPDLWTELTRCGLEGEHTAQRDKTKKKKTGKTKGKKKWAETGSVNSVCNCLHLGINACFVLFFLSKGKLKQKSNPQRPDK